MARGWAVPAAMSAAQTPTPYCSTAAHQDRRCCVCTPAHLWRQVRLPQQLRRHTCVHAGPDAALHALVLHIRLDHAGRQQRAKVHIQRRHLQLAVLQQADGGQAHGPGHQLDLQDLQGAGGGGEGESRTVGGLAEAWRLQQAEWRCAATTWLRCVCTGGMSAYSQSVLRASGDAHVCPCVPTHPAPGTATQMSSSRQAAAVQ